MLVYVCDDCDERTTFVRVEVTDPSSGVDATFCPRCAVEHGHVVV